jgi:hypothetical protein
MRGSVWQLSVIRWEQLSPLWVHKNMRVVNHALYNKKNSVILLRKRTIPTERPQPVGEVSANFIIQEYKLRIKEPGDLHRIPIMVKIIKYRPLSWNETMNAYVILMRNHLTQRKWGKILTLKWIARWELRREFETALYRVNKLAWQ